jgi:hypothetical protein
MYVFFLLPFSLKGLLFLSGDTSNNLSVKHFIELMAAVSDCYLVKDGTILISCFL